MNKNLSKIKVVEVLDTLYKELFITGQEDNYDVFFDTSKEDEYGISNNHIDPIKFTNKIKELNIPEGKYDKVELRWNISDDMGKHLYSLVGLRDETDEEFQARLEGVSRVQTSRAKRVLSKGERVRTRSILENMFKDTIYTNNVGVIKNNE